MNKEDGKKQLNKIPKAAWKIFLLIFIINIIVLNWSDIYWVFNPKVGLEGIRTLFEKEETVYYEEEDGIEIPAIEIKAPIVETEGTTDEDYKKALDKGVTHFPDSVYPGEKGISILLGHSAPPGWPKINYDWVFSDLGEIETGDEIIIYFQNKKYIYTVTNKIFLEIGEDTPSWTSNKPEIILLSCWPPGKNIERIGIQGVISE